MAVVVIGGHSRNVGKTSVVAGLIAAMPELHWTALKITQYGHNVCADCATADHSHAITEERDRTGDTDTSRFLVAGADRVFWVRTRVGELAPAVPKIRQIIDSSTNVIVESNSIMKFIRPDLYLTVLDPANKDFKDSARWALDRADAILIHESTEVAWTNVSLRPVVGRPTFQIAAGKYVTPEIVDFVRQRLASKGAIPSKVSN
jgi:molybdopterin-guanine dinucleotide biosynthesis protein